MRIWVALALMTMGGAVWGQNLFEVRGGIENCRVTFAQEKKGRIAYLGGSITAAPGWRDLTYDMFKARFPEVEFDFVNAGIGGTNSTLGAFRLEEEVFGRGPVDLLFVEFAVNDGGGDSPDDRSGRAMEGIIRHARRLNPNIDIIVQYFADTDKVEAIRAGRVPASIAQHDKVMQHYQVPVINMAGEVTRRLDANEFAWEDFSRDTCHPQQLGHQLYADCIGRFLDAAWAAPAREAVQPHVLPEPLDAANYEQGRFVALEQARILSGWKRIPEWDTEKKCNYGGAVDVLAAEAPGDTLDLEFEGRLIAIKAIAGMDAGILSVSIDGGPATEVDLFDHYCTMFHRPVCRVLAEDLPPGTHTLRLTMADKTHEKSAGYAARILRFAAN